MSLKGLVIVQVYFLTPHKYDHQLISSLPICFVCVRARLWLVPAGHDVLYVGVSGPVVACEEVNIKHMGEGQYMVNYVVRDRGLHLIMVKWGDQHIPGSPFTVNVV